MTIDDFVKICTILQIIDLSVIPLTLLVEALVGLFFKSDKFVQVCRLIRRILFISGAMVCLVMVTGFGISTILTAP